MREHGFPALKEHEGEHRRAFAVARDMRGFLERGRPRLVREYLRGRLLEWFELHRCA